MQSVISVKWYTKWSSRGREKQGVKHCEPCFLNLISDCCLPKATLPTSLYTSGQQGQSNCSSGPGPQPQINHVEPVLSLRLKIHCCGTIFHKPLERVNAQNAVLIFSNLKMPRRVEVRDEWSNSEITFIQGKKSSHSIIMA